MRKPNPLTVFASLTLLGSVTAGGAFLACSSSSTNGMEDGGSDAKGGGDAKNDHKVTDAHHEGHNDASDSGGGGDSGGPATKLYAINGFLTVDSPIQFCFSAATKGDPGLKNALSTKPMPAAGLAAGEGIELSVPSLVGQNVRVVAYYQSSLKSFSLTSDDCAKLFSLSGLVGDGGVLGDGGSTLLQGLDFEISDVIDSSVFKADTKYLLPAMGCPKSSDPVYFPPGAGYPSGCGYIEKEGGAPNHLGDIYIRAYGMETTAPPSGMSRLQGSCNEIVAVFSMGNFNPPYGLGNWQYFVSYGSGDASAEASVQAPLQGPLFTNGGSPTDAGLFNVQEASGPLPPGTNVPALSGANGLADLAPLVGFPDSYPMAQVLQLSGLKPSDLTGTMTMVVMGNPFDPTGPVLSDGGFNPRFQSARLVPNK